MRDGTTEAGGRDSYALTGTARRIPGQSVVDFGSPQLDMRALRAYRLGRVQAGLKARGLPAILLFDPILVRYATGMRNMQAWSLHTQIRSAFVPAEGKAVLFEYGGSEHLGSHLETVAETRKGTHLVFGPGASEARRQTVLSRWAEEIKALLAVHAGAELYIAIDRQVNFAMGQALEAAGLRVVDGYALMAEAQAIKSAEEVACMTISVSVTETALAKIRAAVEPGVTENRLWSILNQVNAEHGGDYVDTRLLSSGGRTNPWFQEATDRRVRPGELVALDSDTIGPYGYDADVSRTFFCGPGRPSGEQRTLYRIAWEHVHHNMALIRPGKSFRELSEQAFPLPERFRLQQYGMDWHGVGLYGQWPTILARGLFNEESYDGVVEEGMTLCVESYVGEPGGLEGVKLEQQILVTKSGYELLSLFPFEEELLGREI